MPASFRLGALMHGCAWRGRLQAHALPTQSVDSGNTVVSDKTCTDKHCLLSFRPPPPAHYVHSHPRSSRIIVETAPPPPPSPPPTRIIVIDQRRRRRRREEPAGFWHWFCGAFCCFGACIACLDECCGCCPAMDDDSD